MSIATFVGVGLAILILAIVLGFWAPLKAQMQEEGGAPAASGASSSPSAPAAPSTPSP